MRDILNCLTLFCNLPQENVKRLLTAGVAEALSQTNNALVTTNCTNDKRDSAGTQTEIIAVHTPQLENQSNFPFTKVRPSTLALLESQNPNTPSSSSGGGGTTINTATATTSTTDADQNLETPTNHKRLPLEESGVISDDVRSSNDSMSFAEKQDDDEKHNMQTSTVSG